MTLCIQCCIHSSSRGAQNPRSHFNSLHLGHSNDKICTKYSGSAAKGQKEPLSLTKAVFEAAKWFILRCLKFYVFLLWGFRTGTWTKQCWGNYSLYKKKNKTENVGTDQNSKLLSDPPHFHGSDMAEPGFDCVQILEDNRPWFRYPARIWEN